MHSITKTLIQRSPAPLRPAVTLIVGTVDDTVNDRVPGLAAEMAFFLLLSLPPLMITLLAGVGQAGKVVGSGFQHDFADGLLRVAGTVLSPAAVNDVIRPTVDELVREGSGTVLSVAFIVTLWTASRALKVVLTSLSIAYNLPDERTGFQQRLWGLGLTVVGLVVSILVVPVVVAGPEFGQQVEQWIGIEAGLAEVWALLYWPGVVVVVTSLIASLYHFGAPWSTPWHRDIPGALLAMAIWSLGTLGLRVYLAATVSQESGSNPLPGVLALLLWFYVSGIAVLVGAEFNAQIEQLWPVHRQPPENARDPADEVDVDDQSSRAGPEEDGHTDTATGSVEGSSRRAQT